MLVDRCLPGEQNEIADAVTGGDAIRLLRLGSDGDPRCGRVIFGHCAQDHRS